MAIELIDTLSPKNNGTFPMVLAKDVDVDGKRLPDALKDIEAGGAEEATDAEIDALFNMGDLAVTATAREGGQTVTVAPAVSEDNQRRYMVTDASAAPYPVYDETAPLASGWAALPDDGAISGTEGQVVTVVDCTINGAKVRACGSATLPAPLTV